MDAREPTAAAGAGKIGKYHFQSWRPTSAITLADTDGNSGTEPDPAWTQVVATPNHPESPAAHSCVIASPAESLARHFSTRNVTFSTDSTVTNSLRVYQSFAKKRPARAGLWGMPAGGGADRG